jgi:hypothetical protein
VNAEAFQRAAGGLGLTDAAVGQRTFVIGKPVRGLGVTEQPEHR